MKKKGKFFLIAGVLGALTLAVAVPIYVRAATSNNTTGGHAFGLARQAAWGGNWKNLTADQQAALQAKLAAAQAQRAAKEQAIKDAIAANDYNAWVQAVGANSPLAQKITADNFAQYVALYNLEQQVQAQRQALGLNKVGLGLGHFGFGPKNTTTPNVNQ